MVRALLTVTCVWVNTEKTMVVVEVVGGGGGGHVALNRYIGGQTRHLRKQSHVKLMQSLRPWLARV